MILLCDGRLVCGCADPYGRRVLGDTRTSTVSAIWTGPVASSLRSDLNHGGSKFCGDCPLKLPLKKDELAPERPLSVPPLPTRLYIECTAACNISCNQACCAPETGITRTRQAGVPLHAPVLFPVISVLSGRRNHRPAEGIRPLCVYGPIHYQELPELFMDYVCSLTGTSPSTTGAGSEGALTKGPFNALAATADRVSCDRGPRPAKLRSASPSTGART